MKNDAYAVGIYAAIVLLGGLIGFWQAGSMASLIAGGGSGAVLAYATWGIAKGCRYGYYIAAATSVALLLFFGYRLAVTAKFMTAGLMLLLSIAMCGYLAKSLCRCKQGSACR
jgi:uncharacterized membrane protein (UPF0136 family)